MKDKQQENLVSKKLQSINLIGNNTFGEIKITSAYYELYGKWPSVFKDCNEYNIESFFEYLEITYELDMQTSISAEAVKGDEYQLIHFLCELPNEVLVLYNGDEINNIKFAYSSKEGRLEIKKVQDALSTFLKDRAKSVYMLTKHYDGFDFKPYNIISDENKEQAISTTLLYNSDFQEVSSRIEDLLTAKKQGLVLLYGKPGTGKTSYLKSLIGKIDRKIIYIPSELVRELGSPGMLEALMNEKGAIIVIEDAELALYDRGHVNSDSAAVSTLLNISDGFLAEALKITVICTFNTSWKNIDEAITRKGRILAKYEFKELEKERVKKLFSDRGIEGVEPARMTLAEAMNTGADSAEIITTKIGF